ncbi:MAG: hypothetical protein KF887_02705 [Paracoccaceae bacterium]|nr:MAG: hypothetical protein KF887_02705 [Paracoccaceae bacterium]
MFGTDRIEERKFYRFGSRKGHRPVRVWVGRIDGVLELGATNEPIASCIVMALREGMPRLGHAPFYLSTMLADPFDIIPPFDLSGLTFDAQYQQWRREWDAGQAEAWEIGPTEVYSDMLRHLMDRGKQ